MLIHCYASVHQLASLKLKLIMTVSYLTMKVLVLYSSQNQQGLCFLCFPFEGIHQFLSASQVWGVGKRNCLHHTCCSCLAINYTSKSTYILYNIPSLHSTYQRIWDPYQVLYYGKGHVKVLFATKQLCIFRL